MKKTLCLVIFLLSFVIGFSQNRFYAIDVVQAKIDSNNYMSAISYIESLEKIDIDTAWSLFPQKAYCYYKNGNLYYKTDDSYSDNTIVDVYYKNTTHALTEKGYVKLGDLRKLR